MPLRWSIAHDPDFVLVRGAGRISRPEIEKYLDDTIAEGARGYPKLILLDRGVLALSPADLDGVAERMIRYGRGGAAGPLAMVVTDPLNLDMVVLLKQRIGARPFSIFVDIEEAERWLASFYHGGAAVDRIAARYQADGHRS
jgi:hypothetical protein